MKTLLMLCKVKSHSKENQFIVLLSILKNYDITWNLEAVVADNSDTNDTLCQKIEAHLLQAENIVWNSEHWQLHCLDHIINLAVQAFLFHDVLEMKKVRSCDESEKFEEINEIIKWKFQLLEFLDKLHNIIVHTHSLTDHATEFKELTDRMISLDNCTRWNSWYACLLVADKHKSSINIYIKKYNKDLLKNYLTFQDWKKLHVIMNFLQSFEWVTLKTEEHHVTLDKVLWTMNILIWYFENALVNKYNVFSKITYWYNRWNMSTMKIFMLKFRENEMFLTNIMSKQTWFCSMLLFWFCILCIVLITSRTIDHSTESSLFWIMWQSFERLIEIRVIRHLCLE